MDLTKDSISWLGVLLTLTLQVLQKSELILIGSTSFHPYSFNPLSFNRDLFTPLSFNPLSFNPDLFTPLSFNPSII